MIHNTTQWLHSIGMNADRVILVVGVLACLVMLYTLRDEFK